MKKAKKQLLLYLAAIFVNVTLLGTIATLAFFRFKYPYVSNWGLFLQLSLYGSLPIMLSIIFIALRKVLKAWLKTMAIILTISSIPLTLYNMTLFYFASPFGSQTNHIDHYLKLESYVDNLFSRDVFPEVINESAENVRYFYRFRHCIEGDYDIYLQVSLPLSEFEREKVRIDTQYPDAVVVENGSGVIEYQIKFVAGDGSYHYLLVRFSEHHQTVTYIEAYALDDGKGAIIPYFKERERSSGS